MSKFNQYESKQIEVTCPNCKEGFALEVEIGINQPEVEIDIVDFTTK